MASGDRTLLEGGRCRSSSENVYVPLPGSSRDNASTTSKMIYFYTAQL